MKTFLKVLACVLILAGYSHGQTTTTVNFDSPACSGALSGTYGGIKFSSPWGCEKAGIAGNSTTSLSWFSNVQSSKFSFVSASVLNQFQLGSTGGGTITLSTDAGETVSAKNAANTWLSVTTNFSKPATVITVSYTGGWTLELDNLQYTTGTAPPPVVNPTATLAANPTSVVLGQTTMLTWSTTNATSVTLNNMTVAASGTQVVTPVALSTTYTLVAIGSTSNATATATVTVSCSPPPPAVVSVTVTPTTANLQANGTQQFLATVTGSTNASVTWSATGGTVSSTGLYTAPSTAGSFTVTATSVADVTKTAAATVVVTVPPPPVVVGITIAPTSASLSTGGTQTFTASVSGSTNTGVTWSATSGTITSAGVYTAPSAAGTDTVTATAQADVTKTASAQVTVNAVTPPPSGKFEGYGQNATGGTNVVHVTTLASSGTGSFAAALQSGNHVVFDVGGTINGTFYIPSNFMLDGFSAPAPGITFTGGTGSAGILNVQNVSNIVIQGVRIRNTSNDNTKGIMFYESGGTNHDVVVDHCDIQNVTDEDIGSSGHDITLSWNLFGSPASSGGNLIKYNSYHWSVIHNLWVGFTGNDSRVPLVWAGDDSKSNTSWNGNTIADVVGNVITQFLYGITYVTDGTLQDHSNIINNYLDGQDTDHARNGLDIMASTLEQHYIAGNASVINPAGSPSTYGCGASNICGTYSVTNSNKLSGGQVSTPFAGPAITTSCVYDATARIAEWNNVINTAGVVSHYPDDSKSAALRSKVTKPSTTILGQTWNTQSGVCQ